MLLIVAAHAAVVLMLPGSRSSIGWRALATSVSVGAVTPFLVFAHGQMAQVGWISPLGAHAIGEVAREQYFDQSVPFAVLAAAVVVAALAFRRPSARLPDGRSHHLVVLAVVWIVVPSNLLCSLGGQCTDVLPALPVLHRAGGRVATRGLRRRGGQIPDPDGRRAGGARRGGRAQLPLRATWSVRQGRNGLQPGGRCHRRACRGR